MTNIERKIWVTFQKEGIHAYPEAPDDVAHLRYPHRHVFHFKVSIEVDHGNRDIEFQLLKRKLERLYGMETLKLDNKSCEMLSDELYENIVAHYPGRAVTIEVSEDGENGSYTNYCGVAE